MTLEEFKKIFFGNISIEFGVDLLALHFHSASLFWLKGYFNRNEKNLFYS